MSDKRWFDRFTINTRVIDATSRRDAVRALAALIPGAALGVSGAHAGNRRGNRGKPDKPRPKPKPQDLCAANFHTKRDRKHCQFVQRQCDGDDPRDFCIIGNFVDHVGEPVAVCCEESQKCCGGGCCDKDIQCCGGGCCGNAPDWACCNDRCRNTKLDSENCGGCGNQCPVGQFCEDGRCLCPGGPCDPACPTGLTFCNGECVDTQADPRHCGGCNAVNPNGLKCCNGNLCTYIDGVCCGSTCYPSGWPSCG